jgi:hypothetical protein
MRISNVSSSMTELNIQSNEKVKYRIWTPSDSKSGVVVYAYEFGEQLDDKQVQQVAETISKQNNLAVLVIEYSGTKMKRSDDLLKKLEDKLPQFLDNVKEYTSDSIRQLIENKRYQDAINELFYALPASYPLNLKTIIPLYGGPEEYSDYGLAPALDIINTIDDVANEYPDLNWNDCIGFGFGYGGYLIDLCERLSPGLFSLILNARGYVAPTATELFCNMTEWENGIFRITQANKIGKLPIHLVDFQGWTTNPSHCFHFAPQHFDIRNLANDHLIKTNLADKDTLRVVVDFSNSDEEYLESKREYIHMLLNQGYKVDYSVLDEKDVSLYNLLQNDNKTILDHAKFFNYIYKKQLDRNIKQSERLKPLWFPVYGGVYIFYHANSKLIYKYITMMNFDKDENKEIHAMVMADDCKDQIIDSIVNPISNSSEKYMDMLKLN